MIDSKYVERYAIGEQDFKSLREMGCVYVDKTQFIAGLLDSRGKYFFLARPRRFGKSLFLSALHYFFEGERDLFKGLYIDSIDWDWARYPVLHLDLNVERYSEEGMLEKIIDNIFRRWEEQYDVPFRAEGLSSRFSNIIAAAHEKTGRQVVILVDEYDKPLVGNMNDDSLFEHHRSRLAVLYSNFKSSAAHIRMVFLTGVSRFSRLSVFSDLNNINDITFDNTFADICGITEIELAKYFQQGIAGLAGKYNVSGQEICMRLKENYDGYRFAEEGSDVYNPWSVLNCMAKKKFQNYWNQTGVPTVVVESLRRVNADLERIFDSWCKEDDLKGLDLQNPRPVALMFQTGYLTIKDYEERVDRYRLGIPNREVKEGLYTELLPVYMKSKSGISDSVVAEIVTYAILGKPEDFMKSLQTFFAGISYKMKMDNENNFHNAFFLLTSLMGLNTQTEVSTSDGSIDMVIETVEYIYIVELKFDGSARSAIDQINEGQYARPYQLDSRKLFKIGVNFSSQTRCIEDWIIL